jgi:thioredoxin reductase (NADPH)
MSAYLVNRIVEHPQIEVRRDTQVAAVEEGSGHLAAVTLTDRDGIEERLEVVALFLCIGGAPQTGWAEDSAIELDPRGFILTGPDLLRGGQRPRDWPLDRDPLAVETSLPGLFAAGDVRSGSTKRVAGAVGDGAMAVALAHMRIAELDRAAAADAT